MEIYNGQADSFDLSTLALAITVDSPEQIGNHELWVNFPSGSQIASGDVYIISHSGASSEILNKSDFTYDNLSDGNDGISQSELLGKSSFHGANLSDVEQFDV